MFGTVATTPFIARSDRDTLQAIADLTVKPQDDLAEPAETGDNENDTETEDPR